MVVEPESGRLAGGDVGTGRLADVGVIVATVLGHGQRGRGASRRGATIRQATAADLAGVRVVVSAGGTREAIDPVRYITNRSSGKQGHALAAAAVRRGAEVVLVTTSAQPVADGVVVDAVETAADMEKAMLDRADRADVVIMAAAVADFRPKTVAGHQDPQVRRRSRHRVGADPRHPGRAGDDDGDPTRSWSGSPPKPITSTNGRGPSWPPRAST